MIAHGRKQISEMVYARKASEGGGAVRLTNMIRGGAVVFGGLAPSSGWLTGATCGAILGAFGDDGYAVIKATNAYLNGIAATDPTKATALAGFINQYPLDAALYGGLYVQDGLVFQMDRAYECTAAKWTDFIGGVEFNGTNVQIVDDVPTFNGSARYVSDILDLYSYNTHTIEIIYQASGSLSGYALLFYPDGDSLGAGFESSSHLLCKISSMISPAYAPVVYGDFSVVTFNKDRCAVNGQIVTKASGSDAWGTRGTGKTFIGSRNTENYFKGKIYGIRVYSKLLTEQEILANQAIDLQRWQTP